MLHKSGWSIAVRGFTCFGIALGFVELWPLASAQAALSDVCLSIVVDLPDNGAFESNQIDDSDRFSPGYLNGVAQLYPMSSAGKQDIRVCAQICPDKGGEDAAKVAELAIVTFGFVEQSQIPGISNNYPLSGGETADIAFANGATGATAPMTLIAPGYAVACVPMEVYDYGAYSTLYAQTTVTQGLEEPLFLLDNEAVPRDKNGNKIADADALHDACTSANDDSETAPAGDGYNGDGLSCFEEWRGFVSHTATQGHFRTNPNVKTLFIQNDTRVANGEKIVEEASGLEVFTFMGLEDFDPDERTVNHNSTVYHLVDQHGLVVLEGITDTDEGVGGYAEIHDVGVDQSTPGRCVKAVISRSDVSADPTWADSTFVHEVMHCLGVPHHGDNNVGIGNGSVAMVGGQNSGDQICAMRYDSASYYEPGLDANNDGTADRYAYFPPSGSDETLNAMALCASKVGTDTNAGPVRTRPEDGAPYPKTQDASSGGDCTHSFRVNDL